LGIYSYIDLFQEVTDAQIQSFLNVSRLLKLRDDINKILDRKANELRSQLSMLGHAPRGSLKGRKVPPKYRSPSGETWAGRGARPRWLVEALKRGKKVDDFLIDKSARRRVKRRRSK
jgi:DNA-binding protein H-NS